MGAFPWDDSRGGLTPEIQELLAMFTPSKEEECGIKGFRRPAHGRSATNVWLKLQATRQIGALHVFPRRLPIPQFR